MIPALYILAALGLTAYTILADVVIKNASLYNAFTGWKLLLLGCIMYGSTAVGWFFLLRKVKLFTLAIWFSVTAVLLITLVSIFYFKEKITTPEIVGILFACVSLVLLAKFG